VWKWPDGKVNIYDQTFVNSRYLTQESQLNWDYAAEITVTGISARKCDVYDTMWPSRNFGNQGNYYTCLWYKCVNFTYTNSSTITIEPCYGSGYVDNYNCFNVTSYYVYDTLTNLKEISLITFWVDSGIWDEVPIDNNW